MAVENAAFPSELSVANPTAGDPVGEGYEHITLLKGVLKNTFPNLDDQVVATPDQLNNPILATDLPPLPASGQVQVQSIPFYSSNSTASTTPVTTYGKSLLAMSNSAALADDLDLDGLVKKTGDIMTGPLQVPVLRVANAVAIYVNSAGDPTLELGTSKIVYDVSAKTLDVWIEDTHVAQISAIGHLKAANNVTAGASI